MKQNDSIYIILIFAMVMLLNINWIYAVIKGNDLGIEEGYSDLASIMSLSKSQNLLYYDSRTYGQPTEGLPYGKLSVLGIPILLNFIIRDTTASFVITIIILLFLTSSILFILLSREFKLGKEISLFFSLLYIISYPLLVQMFTHGHLKYLILISLPIIYLYIWIKFFNTHHYRAKLPLLFIANIISLAAINAQIIGFSLFLILLICTTPFIIKIEKKYYIKMVFIILTFMIPSILIWILYYKLYYSSFFNFEGFSSSTFNYYEMSQPLLIFFQNIGRGNRIPLELQASIDPLFNFIFSLPFFLFLTFFITTNINRKSILFVLIFSVMFLGSGIYGPFSFIFNEYSLPFRAPGRTFLPASFPFLIIFGAIGCNNIIKNTNTIKTKVLFVFSIFILSVSAYLISSNYQFVYHIDSDIHIAYSKIPPYNRVMMIPVWGDIGSMTSLSYNGTYDYQQYPTVGYSLVHLHEYMTVRHNLKDVFAPPSKWESPFLTTWTISDFLWEKIMKWNDYDGFYQHMKLFPNLRYLIIYKHILPQNIVDGLSKNQKVEIAYENEKVSILKIKNQISSEIITSNNAFLLYTSSWHYGHSTILTLLDKYHVNYPIIFEATTPWYMLKSDQFDENMTLIFDNIYSTKDLILDYYLFNDKFNKDYMIKFNKKQLGVIGFWQPSYDKMYIYLENNGGVSGKIDIDKKGEYRILIRTVYNGIWRDRYSVNLDGNNIMNYDIEKNHFGWGWINSSKLFLEEGHHELKIIGIEEYIDINTVIVITEDEYNNIISRGHESNKDISQKRCISGYEFEHIAGFENVSEENAISGGHVRPYIVKGIVNTNIFSPCNNIKYAIMLGNISELKINNISLNPINLNNGLILYKLPEVLDKNDNIFLYAKGDDLDAIWLTNFDPIELYNIKTSIVDTPKSYWGEYTFQYSPDQKFILLLKSYSPMFDIKYKDNKYRPYVANMISNGFYIKEPDNNGDNNISMELSYLNVLRDV